MEVTMDERRNPTLTDYHCRACSGRGYSLRPMPVVCNVCYASLYGPGSEATATRDLLRRVQAIESRLRGDVFTAAERPAYHIELARLHMALVLRPDYDWVPGSIDIGEQLRRAVGLDVLALIDLDDDEDIDHLAAHQGAVGGVR